MPFGMDISVGTIGSPQNYYLYNKKELQPQLGLYDYGARFYDPVIARWTTVDPLIESDHEMWSPYVYVYNDAIRFNDPDGRDTTGIIPETGDQTGLIRNSTNYLKDHHPYEAATVDLIHEIFDALGINSIDNAIANNHNHPSAKAKTNIVVVIIGAILNSAEGGEGEGLHEEVSGGSDSPIEPYNRQTHYGKTPKASDRKALGADNQHVVNHEPPLVQRYHEGDPKTGEKPGKNMTPAERRASANDRSRMNLQTNKESAQQGAAMSRYSREKNKQNGN